MFEFQWPWLLLLLPLPLLVWWAEQKKQRRQALKAPLFLYWKVQNQQGKKVKSQFPWYNFILWFLLLLAVARPTWVGDSVALPSSGRDLMVSIDISGSMEREDMVLETVPVNRLVAVKALMKDFIKRRQGDRLGLILFGEQAYLQTPLTFDLKTVQTMLDESEIGLAGSSRTAIGDSIGLAVKRLKDRDAETRVMILLTDGQNNTGILNPIQAAELAEHAGVTIYTIGIGDDKMVVRNSFFGNRTINPSKELDEKTLTAIAEKTGGQYFRAKNTQELEQIYAKLDQLEPVEDIDQRYRPSKALFFIPLLAALLLSFLKVAYKLLRNRLMVNQTDQEAESA
ncbi:vWA domain-containing protein [Kangiella sediminilitoris]|uniref:von Willebrand factor type A n=1 Tax=Kangiella sediminilitoris TaxID=1144748 RepID=A0A1B3B990_9GAMM|nr:VWA domain-containing protein [Kangiella sediminilitoris]AOE49316.1 von Willebrand factor type A [Kangiella sediminilitoris]